MSDLIKCPVCGGTKCEQVSGNNYRCLYCGSNFVVDSPVQEQKAEPQQQPTKPQQPVQPQQPAQPQVIYVQTQPQISEPRKARIANRNRVATILLALFLGGFGIHQFYLGNTGRGILYLLFCWTLIPSLVALFDFFVFLFMSDSEFDQRYNYR